MVEGTHAEFDDVVHGSRSGDLVPGHSGHRMYISESGVPMTGV